MGLNIGKLLGGVVKLGTNLLPGPVGAIARGVVDTIVPSPSVPRGLLPAPQGPIRLPSPFGVGGTNPFPMGPLGPDLNPNQYPIPYGGGVMSPLGTQSKCPQGYHINKALIKAAMRQTPSNVKRAQQVVHACVRNRKMNVLNVRALNRGIRRMHGAAKTLKTVLRLTSPKPPKGRVIPKRKHRRS